MLVSGKVIQKAVIAGLAVSSLMAYTRGLGAEGPGSQLMQAHFRESEEFGNVFSRSIAFTVPGYEDVVRRVSGTGAYRVTKTSRDETTLDGRFVYDGNPASTGITTIKDTGRTLCWNQQCSPSTDASGLSINPILWGNPSGKLHVGQSWSVDIQIPWELGPPGRETITVVAVDSKTGMVRLKREGTGDGSCADDIKRIPLKSKSGSTEIEPTYGTSVWTGYATFQHGIVISDTLLVQRHFKGVVDGKEVNGTERQYVLLNAIDPKPLRQ